MGINKKNIYNQPDNIKGEEIFEILQKGEGTIIEKISTIKQYSEPGQWYDQELDEWVLLLKGKAVIEIKNESLIALDEGDYIFLPAHKIHRIKQTSNNPPCIWLAVHGKLL